MKRSKFQLEILVALGCSLVFITSCKKFLAIDKPINQLTTDAVFVDSASATTAVNGLYSSITDNYMRFLDGRITINCSLAADEIYQATSSSTPNVFATNNIPTNSSDNSSCWSEGYKGIYHANAIIENLQKAENIAQSVKDRLTAEVKFIRAINYFYLLNLYGDVPLVLTTDYRINAVIPKSASSLVYAQILADLQEAQGIFNSQDPSFQNLKVNKWAIASLLARVYLFQKDWDNAIDQSTAVINSGKFSLASPNDVFLINSPEVILQLMPTVSLSYNAAEGYAFIPSSATALPKYALRDGLLQAFEDGDLRKTNWLKTRTVSGKDYTYPYKYKVRNLSPSTSKLEYDVVLRLAEQYLIRAEAYAQQGKINPALTDLDVIRTRAGLGKLSQSNPTIGQSDLLNTIYHERQTELFAEWGNRWLDLKRIGRADAVLAPLKGADWQTTDQLFPIPESELNANPKLNQNEGY